MELLNWTMNCLTLNNSFTEAAMPLTTKGRKILRHMENEYGTEKGKSVFYAARNKGRITSVETAGKPRKKKTQARRAVRVHSI